MAELLNRTEIIQAVQAALEKKDFNDESWKLIQRATSKVLERCQQDFRGSAEDASSRASNRLSNKLRQSLLNVASNFYDDAIDFDGSVLPQNCRYIRRNKGAVSLVIEQPPTVRTISLSSGKHRLAMPYCLFVLNFVDSRFSSMYCGWRKAPMKSLEDTMGPICLPNMNEGLHPCWGSTAMTLDGKTVAEQAEEVITKYWMSSFNNDLSGYYTNFLSRNSLDGAEGWQRKTAGNSLWILKADFSTSRSSLASFLLLSAEKTDRRDHFISNVSQQITQTVVEISNEVQRLIVQMNFDANNRPKFAQEELSGVIKEIIIQAYTELCEYNEAVLSRERVRLEDELASILREYERKKERKDTW